MNPRTRPGEAREPCGRLQRLLCLPYAEIGLGELEQRQWIPGTSRLCSLKVDECAPVLFFLKVKAPKVQTGGLISRIESQGFSKLRDARGLLPGADVAGGKIIVKTSVAGDRKSTRLNSSHGYNSHAVFCLKKKKGNQDRY